MDLCRRKAATREDNISKSQLIDDSVQGSMRRYNARRDRSVYKEYTAADRTVSDSSNISFERSIPESNLDALNLTSPADRPFDLPGRVLHLTLVCPIRDES